MTMVFRRINLPTQRLVYLYHFSFTDMQNMLAKNIVSKTRMDVCF